MAHPDTLSTPELVQDAAPEAGAGRRGRGAAARRAQRSGGGPGQSMPFILRKLGNYEVLDEEGLALIERNADTVLEEIGIEFRDDAEAIALWREAGADVKGERVRFPKGLCRELLKTAPECSPSMPAIRPVRADRRQGHRVRAGLRPALRARSRWRAALCDDRGFPQFREAAYMAPALHHSGGTVCEPVDVPVNKRHFDMVYSHMKYSDKPFMGSVTAPERAEDTIEMCKILFGAEFVDQNCVTLNLINANSPMVFDETMVGALKVYARNNQACVVSPFILAGAMSPVTVAGTLTQILAEVLAGAAFTQLVRPGAPVLFGTFAASISMQSGAPTFGTPEPALVSYGAAQLARRLKIPFRTGGSLCGSKVPDAQAAHESASTLNMTLLAGTNFALHSAGWLEGGLVSSYEKFMIDVDQLGMQQRFAEGVDLSETGQALDAIAEVGPGNHYLGCAHTQANFQQAFYRSSLADNNSYEQWLAEGEKRIEERARALCRSWLDGYVAPELDPAIDEALLAYITGRKDSMPDAFT
jgi:trimethylamine--corrinoid protein Co-methyltransferase